jgi:hypothetical protein
MIASPGMLVVTTPVSPLTDKVVYAPGGPGPPVHLRQRPDGTVLLGERSQEAVAYDPSLEHARALLAQAARFFPALGRPSSYGWSSPGVLCRLTGCRSSAACRAWSRSTWRSRPAG